MGGGPRFFGPDEVAELLPWPALLDSVEAIMIEPDAFAPERTVHTVPVAEGDDASFLLKPGWVVGDVIVVKAVTFFPENGSLGLATINAGVLVFDGSNGTLVGACDGNELTTRRTAAASAVAARRLARSDASRLLIIGTGALAPRAAQAHASVRNYDTIEIWGRDPAKAQAVVELLSTEGLDATVSSDLDESVAAADVISCVTGATEPLVRGSLLEPGAHIDLIGAFTPEMRESDDDCIRRADVYVDTRTDGILAGDLSQPLATGLLTLDDIVGDLAELVAGTAPGRSSDDQITLFKSAGVALEDVAASRLVFGI